MASGSTTGEEPPTSPVVANAPPLVTTEAKMIVATGLDHCQQLKEMLSKEDPSSMVLVVASGNQTSTPPKTRSAPVVMDPGLLAVACSGSWKELQSFLNGDPRPTSSDGPIRCCCCLFRPSSDGTIRCCCFLWKKRQSFLNGDPRPISSDGTIGSSAIQQPSHDEEALLRVSFLDGVTIEGDTFLHVMATNSVGEDLIEDSPGLIHRKALQFLSRQNNNGDTPLHCAARAAKSQMVSFLVDLARGNNDVNTVKALLEKQNNSRWTVLHEAICVGNNDIVNLLMTEDPELASFPQDGTSPLYLAILMENETIARTLHKKSGGVLSYSGPNGQNALHAAVLRGKDLTKILLGWNNALTIQQDENGSTPLHLAASVAVQRQRKVRTIQLLLLEANPDALYQPDNDGLFPTHVAASVDATHAISDFLKKSPNCAGLRDARGRTFLHVAVDQKKIRTVRSGCINQSWILNMQDNDGNTALHLAVQKGSLAMFCALFRNRQVHLNLTNKKGEAPLDIARCNLPEGLYFNQNSEAKIHLALKAAGAKRSICRRDYFGKKDIVKAKQDEIHKIEIIKDSTQNLCIGSVLIATVTFGATFAMPGGYRADDHTNGGTPTLAGRYAFDAFILANALAFAFSTIAVISLMASGSPLYNLRSRVINLRMAFTFMDISVTCLVAAFALGTYMMLAPVAHKAAITVCVVSSLILLYKHLDVAIKNAMVMPSIWWRNGIYHNEVLIFPLSVLSFVLAILFQLWPVVVIFGLTALNYTGRKVEPAAQPPTPFA